MQDIGYILIYQVIHYFNQVATSIKADQQILVAIPFNQLVKEGGYQRRLYLLHRAKAVVRGLSPTAQVSPGFAAPKGAAKGGASGGSFEHGIIAIGVYFPAFGYTIIPCYVQLVGKIC
jgi:hypothetical protein